MLRSRLAQIVLLPTWRTPHLAVQHVLVSRSAALRLDWHSGWAAWGSSEELGLAFTVYQSEAAPACS